MASISLPTALSIGGAVAGAAGSLIGGSKAASADTQAAQLAQQRYTQTRSDLLPYNTAGQSVLPDLTSLAQSGPFGPGGTNYLAMADRNLPGTMTQQDLEKTPGYQFNLSQGLKATQSSAAARGLGVSGAAMKGAATFATGLADSTYQNQFANQQTRYSDILGLNTTQQGNLAAQFGRLQGVASLGENAGAQTGTIGANLAATGGNALIQGGLASAAGTVGAGSAITGAGQNFLGNSILQQMIGGGGTGGFGAPSAQTVSNVGQIAPFSGGIIQGQ
jgi:hypothetical protein